MFGSVARGEDNPDSDIDILIISNNKDIKYMVNEKVLDFILEKEEVISPYIMTEKHFNDTKEYSFLQNVLMGGVVI